MGRHQSLFLQQRDDFERMMGMRVAIKVELWVRRGNSMLES